MNVIDLFVLSIGLAMDAFSVSVCKGLQTKKANVSLALIIAVFFGFFQSVMPLLGYWIVKLLENSQNIQNFVKQNSSLIAFLLIFVIGLKMLIDAIKDLKNNDLNDCKTTHANISLLSFWGNLLFLSFATSIDALVTGFVFATIEVNIYFAIFIIGIVTFTLSFIGFYIGLYFGSKFEKPASFAGAIVLILLSFKFLYQYIFV